MLAGLPITLVLVRLVACEDLSPHHISGPTSVFSNSKSDLKKGIALRGVWVRCPPDVPYTANYINLYICLLLDFFYLSLKHLGAIY